MALRSIFAFLIMYFRIRYTLQRAQKTYAQFARIVLFALNFESLPTNWLKIHLTRIDVACYIFRGFVKPTCLY